jgi:hypothetical protein
LAIPVQKCKGTNKRLFTATGLDLPPSDASDSDKPSFFEKLQVAELQKEFEEHHMIDDKLLSPCLEQRFPPLIADHRTVPPSALPFSLAPANSESDIPSNFNIDEFLQSL